MTAAMDTPPAARVILVIDSNADHVRIIEQALGESDEAYKMVAIASGQQALAFLHHDSPYETAPRPDLILLDLNLPEEGREILAAIKEAPHLRRIPIVVLTLADSDDDIFNSYALQGNCYVIKSTDLDQLHQTVKQIEAFWLGIVTLPGE
ncbi:MAG TPA: response regulator [Trichocoleus sp.]